MIHPTIPSMPLRLVVPDPRIRAAVYRAGVADADGNRAMRAAAATGQADEAPIVVLPGEAA